MNKLTLTSGSFGLEVAYRTHLPVSLAMHCHDFHEMVYVFSGKGKHVTEQGSYDIGPGDLFIVPPLHGHSYEDRENMQLVNIMFDLQRLPYPAGLLKDDPHFRAFFLPDEVISDDFRIRNKLSLAGNDQKLIESQIHDMLNEYTQNRPARIARLIARLSDLFVDIIRFCATERYACTRDLVLLQNILQYMADNCSQQLTIPALARKFGLSQKNLERLFLQSVQMSPVSYLIDLRLRTAAEMLLGKSSTVSEIAFHCGFSDSNYFTKLFRKKYGVPPRTYRKRSQAN
ncbi:MAG: helix-turn-helix domain-containing protein [Lentisphaeria bacterium]|nr:helix-turn-helix domain-containing protein [Lentisphaeria bacterium]